jgi:LysM repeat protein
MRSDMQEHDSNPKDDFVMSGKRPGSEEREDAFQFSTTQESGLKKSTKPFVLAGAGLLVAVIVILMFISGSPRSGEKDQIKNIEGRLKSLEEKLAKLEWIDTGLARLDRKEKEIASISERMVQMEAALNKKADQLSREAAKPVPKPAETHPPKVEAAPAKPAAPPAKVDKDLKAKMHLVQKGDTLFGISRKYGIPADQLIKLNKLDPKDPIKPGQQLMLPPSKNG